MGVGTFIIPTPIVTFIFNKIDVHARPSCIDTIPISKHQWIQRPLVIHRYGIGMLLVHEYP
jgi:hypothetical protein